jgi:hypothetical protein
MGPGYLERHQHREEGEGTTPICVTGSDAQPTPGGGDTKAKQAKSEEGDATPIYFLF